MEKRKLLPLFLKFFQFSLLGGLGVISFFAVLIFFTEILGFVYLVSAIYRIHGKYSGKFFCPQIHNFQGQKTKKKKEIFTLQHSGWFIFYFKPAAINVFSRIFSFTLLVCSNKHNIRVIRGKFRSHGLGLRIKNPLKV